MRPKLHICECNVSLNFSDTESQLGSKVGRVQDFNVGRELHPDIGGASIQLDRELLPTQCDVCRVLV